MRTFYTGATRNDDNDKLDFEGFYSPLVMRRYAEYMHKHRKQEDGTMRASDNWQLGISKEAYIKSGFRHFHDWWLQHRGNEGKDAIEDSICALIFNAQGYLLELLKK